MERDAAQSANETLLDLAPDAIFARDLQRRIISWNKGSEGTYGWSAEEAIGRCITDLLDTQYPVPLEQIERTVAEEGLWEGDLVQHGKDGRRLTVESRWAARRDSSGRLVDILEFNRDITARLATQSEREALRQEAEKERLQNRLSRAQHMESLGQLAGGIAHDFNNLLAVMINYSAFVAEGIEAAARLGGSGPLQQMNDDLNQVRRAAERAVHLTRQLLAFARREELKPQVLDVNEIVRSTSELLRRTLGEHVQLIVALQEGASMVVFDPGQLEQILVNLAVNARDAMPDGGLLRIDTASVMLDRRFTDARPGLRPGPHVRLRVSDTGTGMATETAERAFDPFFTTKPPGQGTGLGLATVYGIVHQASGDVQICSEPGMGTTLTVLMPAAPADAPHAAPRARGLPLRTATILLVEDEDALREVTRRILLDGGHHVIVADGAPSALDALDRHHEPIDLLLSDVIMPQMHGPALALEVRARRPHTKALLMSGFAQPILDSGGRIDPETPLLEKPFSGPELLEKIAEVLENDE